MMLKKYLVLIYTHFIYNLLGYFFKKNVHVDVKTMNLGFQSIDFEKIALLPEDESEYLQFQLYDYLISKININNKDVLEIGCGIGGGCYFVQTYYKPKEVVGIDLINRSIQIAKNRYQHLPIQFFQGDACNLDYPSNTADVIINLESSHGYLKFDNFVKEAYRILRVGGYMVIADSRYTKDIADLEPVFIQNNFTITHQESIRDGVVRALELDNERKINLFNNVGIFKHFFTNMGFIVGSRFYNGLKNGKITYMLYVLKK